MVVVVPSDGAYKVIILNTVADRTVPLRAGDLVFASNVNSTGSEVDLVVLRPEGRK